MKLYEAIVVPYLKPLYGNEAKNLLKAENVTNEMLLFFISRVKVFSGMRLEIEYRFRDELMTMLRGEENG